jgi:methylenetetrahydrofolate reductase (NADPH)
VLRILRIQQEILRCSFDIDVKPDRKPLSNVTLKTQFIEDFVPDAEIIESLGSPLIEKLPPDVQVSFEFFPPKTEKMQTKLWAAIERLAPLQPRFVSVTYGAGGSTRERTHETVVRIQNETDLVAAAHLTCVGASRGEVDDVARRYWDAGVKHIVALRGDPPGGEETYSPHPDGYGYASDLVAGLTKLADFEISVAAYPETHAEAKSADADLDNLKSKIDAGATRAITQLFFDPDLYFRFQDRAAAAGITVPIVPGLMPVTNFKQNANFAKRSGTSVPSWMYELFSGLDDDPGTRELVSASLAAEQVKRLVSGGVSEFHFYTLNRADLSYAICHVLGIRPKGDDAKM